MAIYNAQTQEPAIDRYNETMWRAFLVLALGTTGAGEQNGQLQQILARVAEEADVFLRIAPQTISEETLQQRAWRGPPRFRPQIGAPTLKQPQGRIQEREVVSEYGFSSFKESPNALHEFRQVTSVDGRKVASTEKARRTLSLGIRSDDDRLKQQMLKDFEKHGLVGAVADFGQLILLFNKRRLGDFEFEIRGEGRIGAEETVIVSYHQTQGPESLLLFEGREASHKPLQGQIWVRKTDHLPLRITVTSMRDQKDEIVTDEATVDYVMSPHGVILPVSVVHRRLAGEETVVENVFRYAPFHRFAAESEIKFRPSPAASPK